MGNGAAFLAAITLLKIWGGKGGLEGEMAAKAGRDGEWVAWREAGDIHEDQITQNHVDHVINVWSSFQEQCEDSGGFQVRKWCDQMFTFLKIIMKHKERARRAKVNVGEQHVGGGTEL